MLQPHPSIEHSSIITHALLSLGSTIRMPRTIFCYIRSRTNERRLARTASHCIRTLANTTELSNPEGAREGACRHIKMLLQLSAQHVTQAATSLLLQLHPECTAELIEGDGTTNVRQARIATRAIEVERREAVAGILPVLQPSGVHSTRVPQPSSSAKTQDFMIVVLIVRQPRVLVLGVALSTFCDGRKEVAARSAQISHAQGEATR